jgi:thiamine biosynthesis lipoprotein
MPQQDGLPPTADSARGDFDRLVFPAMGTTCQILFRTSSFRARAEFRRAVVEWVTAFEAKYSRYRPDSLVSKINTMAGTDWVETDDELESMLKLCDWFTWRTGGVFDASTLPIAKLWDYHIENPVLPQPDEIRRALEFIGWAKVQRRSGGIFLPQAGMGIDLGGIGKEYAVDRIFEQSRRWAIEDIAVDFGRDLRVRGEPPEGGEWRVGLEHPLDPQRCSGGVAVRDRAVATSGGYARAFTVGGKSYIHILDPRTGWPVDNGCQSVSVIAPTCTEAGVLSTTAFILGREKGLPLLEQATHVEGCLWAGGEMFATRGLHEYWLGQ